MSRRQLIGNAYFLEGQKCERSKDYQGAIDNYTKALTYAQPTYFIRYMRGCVYQKIGELEKAADDFRAFLLSDTRESKLGTTPWGFLGGAIEAGIIGWERGKAQITLTQVTFHKIHKIAEFSAKL